ncbi:hypothetical protein NEMIN01_0591 [Nematocida minor]|uniref:uncharacterized protein n=1 Tax=Nematocida minor TaxID=1912983 RepID=UPI0022203193|nr:uncharacterized protein NEMIN01_0591 [Nematocida minor]KAI5189638.1 hypothetical protein NEMIN01_0591 [Nematocida minor]
MPDSGTKIRVGSAPKNPLHPASAKSSSHGASSEGQNPKYQPIKNKQHSTSFKKDEESRPFHLSEKSDAEKKQQIHEEFANAKIMKKPMSAVMGLVVRRWFEIFIDLFIFIMILVPETYEFMEILYERYIYHGEKTKPYTSHTAAETFDLWCPILEGIVCCFHTTVFVCESFLGIEIPHGLLIAILSSHITCILIICHIEFIDRKRSKQTHKAITYSIEVGVLILSTLVTLVYFQTHEKYQSLVLITTVLTQYLCRTLTRLVDNSHNKFRKTFNSAEVRVVLFFSIVLLLLLSELLYIYFT